MLISYRLNLKKINTHYLFIRYYKAHKTLSNQVDTISALQTCFVIVIIRSSL